MVAKNHIGFILVLSLALVGSVLSLGNGPGSGSAGINDQYDGVNSVVEYEENGIDTAIKNPDCTQVFNRKYCDRSRFIYRNNQNIEGELKEVKWGLLGNLRTIDLSENMLHGIIPRTLQQLHKLTELKLHMNMLSGSIPTHLGSLTNLEMLELDENNLTGTLPSQLGRLTKLSVLTLSGNHIHGTLSPQLGNLKKLRIFSAHGTSLCTDSIFGISGIDNSGLPGCSTRKPTTDPFLMSYAPSESPSTSGSPTLIPTTSQSPTISPIPFNKETHSPSSVSVQEKAYSFSMTYGVYFSVFTIAIVSACMFSFFLRLKLQSKMKKSHLKESERSAKVEDCNQKTLGNAALDLTQYGGILSVILTLADLVTDILVADSLFKDTDTYFLGICAMFFITAPVIFNIVIVMVFCHYLTEKPVYRRWIEQNEFLFAFIQSFSIFSVEILAFSSCGIWNLNLPLQKHDIYKLRTYSMVNNILEDIPQLIIVIIANSGSTTWSPFSVISLLSSLSSLIWTVLFRFQACSLLYHASGEEKFGEDDDEIYAYAKSDLGVENQVTNVEITHT